MSTLEHLEAAREAAWRELDAAERAIPGCEHVRAWKQRVDAARAGSRKAIAAAEAAAEALRAAPPPSLPAAPEPELDGQEALFELQPEQAA